MRRRFGPQESPQYRLGECTAAESVGDLVYIAGPMSGDRIFVRTCDSTDRAKLPAWAMIVHKDNDTECVLQRWGPCEGIYGTPGPGPNALVPGDFYYVDPLGEVGDYTRPGYVQIVGQAYDYDALWLDFDPWLFKLLA